MRFMAMPARRVVKDETIRTRDGVKAIRSIVTGKMIAFIFYDGTSQEFNPEASVDVVMSD